MYHNRAVLTLACLCWVPPVADRPYTQAGRIHSYTYHTYLHKAHNRGTGKSTVYRSQLQNFKKYIKTELWPTILLLLLLLWKFMKRFPINLLKAQSLSLLNGINRPCTGILTSFLNDRLSPEWIISVTSNHISTEQVLTIMSVKFRVQ